MLHRMQLLGEAELLSFIATRMWPTNVFFPVEWKQQHTHKSKGFDRFYSPNTY